MTESLTAGATQDESGDVIPVSSCRLTPQRRRVTLSRFTLRKQTEMKESDQLESNLEQSQETAQAPHVVSRSDLTEVHEHANKLLEALADVPDGDMVGEIVANSLKL